MGNNISIDVPEDLHEKIKARFVGDRFDSVAKFVEFVLTELIDDTAHKMDQEELELLEQRMKDLGYM